MQKYQDSIILQSGGVTAIGAGLTVKVFVAGTLTLATIYSDNGVTQIDQNTNPIVTDANGNFAFYAPNGHVDIQISGTGITTFTKTDVLMEDLGTLLASNYADASGTVDAIQAAYPSASLIDGYPFFVGLVGNNATTTPTFQPTVAGVLQSARTIKKRATDGTLIAVEAGDLVNTAHLVWDAVNLVYVLMNPFKTVGNQIHAVAVDTPVVTDELGWFQVANSTLKKALFSALASMYSATAFAVGAATAAAHAVRAEQIQGQSLTAFTTAGTSTAYTLTPTPAITAYTAGQCFDVTFNATCGASPTLQISGLATPPNLVRELSDGTYANIGSGEITANHTSRVRLISASQALVEQLPRVSKVGTWTPSLGGSATYSSQVGKYVDMGDCVFVSWDLLVSAIGTGSTTTISGLPFANADTNNVAGSISYFASLVAGVNVLIPIIAGAGNQITFSGNNTGAGSITQVLSVFGTGTRVQGNILYRK